MMTQEEIERLHREAEAEFKKYPGVIGVGYGFKRVAGQTTEVLSFRVYVAEKKEKAKLKPEEIIPTDFKGVATDVVKASDFVDFVDCRDKDYHSPLVGGINISNQKTGSDGVGIGTLGFFGTINGQSGPENVVLVTNHHVLMANGGVVGDTVYQPELVMNGNVLTLDTRPEHQHPIGKIDNAGLRGNHNFQYTGELAAQYWVDAATAKIDISISSWCNTNCGVHFKNNILGLNITRNNGTSNSAIDNVARLKHSDLQSGSPYVVYKVGGRTGRTVGKVTDVGVPSLDGTKQGLIGIEATENDCEGILRFADEGDSGAALINAKNEIIGLVFGGSSDDPKIAGACLIHPVLDKLGVTPITTANPHTAADTFFDVPGVITEGSFNHTPLLREKFLRTERGREIFGVIKTHRMEVVELVNRRRPVTVVWHRNNGPAFLGHLINNARDPEHIVPREVEGVDRETLLRNMANILSKHGSAELRNALDQYGQEIFSRTGQLDNLHELVKQFDVDQSDVQRDVKKEPSTLDSGETV
ncbi:MAG: hypothetical protein PHI13_00320 [Methylococcales bacterium]|nr:hypothetical protein [Methylococcales bacterium]